METFYTFDSAAEARAYRHEHGTGGWIFAPEGGGPAVIFPPHYLPTKIMAHPFTKGQSGDLIGCG